MSGSSSKQPNGVAPKGSFATNAHPGKSRITRELMEQKDREEELRNQWKQRGVETPFDASEPSDTPFNMPEPTQPKVDHLPTGYTPRKDAPEATKEDSKPKVTEKPAPEVTQTIDDPTFPFMPQNETPIEREIRQTNEREDALRVARGLPNLNSQTFREIAYEVLADSSSADKPPRDELDGVTMKKFAVSRLQQEIEKERQRELAMKSKGQISSTSEERGAGLQKYIEIIAKD